MAAGRRRRPPGRRRRPRRHRRGRLRRWVQLIFVDTSFWFALRRLRDPNHHSARSLFERHQDERLVTTNHVRGETWTLVNRREGHPAAVRFLDAVAASPRLRVVQVAEHQEASALTWLRSHDERGYSFVDATSFAVMRALGLQHTLAYDGDFAAAGFVELR